MIRFKCPSCKAKMEVDESFGGRMARCATCGNDLKVPRANEAAPRPGRPGAAAVNVEGEKVEIVPPIESTAVIAVGIVGFSIVAFLAAWLSRQLTPPFAISCLIGGLMALLGAMIALSAWNTVKRSRGRKRGLKLATGALLGGTALFLLFTVGAIVGWAQDKNRPSCEDNLKAIHKALLAYAADHDGAFPPSLNTLTEDKKYLANAESLTCPEYRVTPGVRTYEYVKDIVYNEQGKKVFPPNMMVASDGPPYTTHSNGEIRVLSLDGKIITKPLAEWSTFQDLQRKMYLDAQRKMHPGPVNPTPGTESQPPTTSGAPISTTGPVGTVTPTATGGTVMPTATGGTVMPTATGGSVTPTGTGGSGTPAPAKLPDVVPTPAPVVPVVPVPPPPAPKTPSLPGPSSPGGQ
jgi:hypothetical protein